MAFDIYILQMIKVFENLYHDSWNLAHKELEGTDILREFEDFVKQTKTKMGDFVMNGTALLDLIIVNTRTYYISSKYSYMPVGMNVQKDLMNYYYMDRNVKMAQHIIKIANTNPN